MSEQQFIKITFNGWVFSRTWLVQIREGKSIILTPPTLAWLTRLKELFK